MHKKLNLKVEKVKTNAYMLYTVATNTDVGIGEKGFEKVARVLCSMINTSPFGQV